MAARPSQAALDYARDELDAATHRGKPASPSTAARATIPFSWTPPLRTTISSARTCNIAAGEGFDRAHLTGELAETVNVGDRISGNLTHLDLETQAEVQVFDEHPRPLHR